MLLPALQVTYDTHLVVCTTIPGRGFLDSTQDSRAQGAFSGYSFLTRQLHLSPPLMLSNKETNKFSNIEANKGTSRTENMQGHCSLSKLFKTKLTCQRCKSSRTTAAGPAVEGRLRELLHAQWLRCPLPVGFCSYLVCC
jgi:hypothetical protein